MADYLYVALVDVPNELEPEFNRLYDEEHIPLLAKVPGVGKITRYKVEWLDGDAEGMARYCATYELDSPDLPKTDAWKKQSNTGEWLTKIRPFLTKRAHVMYKKM
ncbi:MAG: hypothetical protein AB7G39_17360 [Alphaproteobacteria bacterium]